MNPFGLTMTAVRGELPVAGIVPAAQLDAYIGAAAVLARNRARAAAILVAARRRRDDAHRRAETIVEAALDEGRRLADESARAAHDRTCASVVRWLVAEQQLEAAVAHRLEARCRDWVAEALACLGADVDRAAVIARRVENRMRDLASHGALTLCVCPAEYEAVKERLARQAGLVLEADPTLQPGQARLDSPYVQLRIDIERHLRHLLDAVAGAGGAEPPAIEPGADTSI